MGGSFSKASDVVSFVNKDSNVLKGKVFIVTVRKQLTDEKFIIVWSCGSFQFFEPKKVWGPSPQGWKNRPIHSGEWFFFFGTVSLPSTPEDQTRQSYNFL